MAQKDKVKELVGRGLDSYHTKALQQMDRIEKKNKEQNHKISILTNELDNDYLTKTEEGSVIYLEHSKEGMVYLDELQGNTLVNYCADGVKELTLNGNIEAEGTNITLTEGADNGLVDIALEGNTIINCLATKIEGNIKFVADGTGQSYYYRTIPKGNTVYTLVANVVKNTINSNFSLIGWHITHDNKQCRIPTGFVGTFKQTFTTKEGIGSDWYMDFWKENTIGEIEFNNFMILEGDWTNKEIPTEYFEGMKSVGECEDNKIEILSNNSNLISETQKEWVNEENPQKEFVKTIDLSPIIDKYGLIEYTLTFDIKATKEGQCRIYAQNGSDWKYFIGVNEINVTTDYVRHKIKFTPTLENPEVTMTSLAFYSIYGSGVFTTIKNIKLQIGGTSSDFVPYEFNKKEISLSEPLRALPNGVKDKIVKIGDKWYVERNCLEYTPTGADGWMVDNGGVNGEGYLCCYTLKSFLKHDSSYISRMILCDKLPFGEKSFTKEMCCYSGSGYFEFILKVTNLDEFKARLDELKPTVIVPTLTPTYEEITNVELITYLDTTHISNNSTIPCNMKVKNSGYNAIIKPSTQYTVAFDTNKSGTVGINLGGAKVTTTNNVATITTPATLADDSLRLHGKGIKASKIRLLEGDKTNWIPSHFEGMKSSFEDKLQDDGSYKMEILSNNGNLINLEEQVRLNKQSGMDCSLNEYNGVMSWEIHTQSYIEYYNYLRYQYKPNTQYTMYFDCNMTPYDDRTTFAIKVMYENGHTETFTMNKDTKNVQFTTLENRTVKKIYFSTWAYSGYVNIYNMKFCEGSGVLVEEKSNKIQFSSIEPLRGVGDVKDRFVFKDGKLMIERNCGVGVLNGSEPWDKHTLTDEPIRSHVFVGACWSKAPVAYADNGSLLATNVPVRVDTIHANSFYVVSNTFILTIYNKELSTRSVEGLKEWLRNNPITYVYKRDEPTYEEIPLELQKIILEGYENGTLFFDTNIPPTVTTTYAGETPIVKATKLNKTEVLNNTNDINDNIVPYLMDMDYRVVCLQLEGGIENVSMARLFGGTYEMLQRDILSNRYSKEEYKYRLDTYLSANKITESEYNKLGDMLNE